jgi:hypothetical protein
MKSRLTNIGINKSWSPKEGDYVRDKYEYDKSHEEIVAKEKKIKRILNVVFFVFMLAVIAGVLHLITSA